MPDKIDQKVRLIHNRNKQKRTVIYIAISLSPETKEELRSKIQNLEQKKYPIIWIDPSSAQIVLLTLGALSADRLEAALQSVDTTAKGLQKFASNAIGLGYFAKERAGGDPSIDARSRWVVYLDVPDHTKALKELFRSLFKNLAKEGFYPTVHFNPRITLGRLEDKKGSREEREMALERLIENEELGLDDFLVDRINVYELQRMGPKLVRSFPLN